MNSICGVEGVLGRAMWHPTTAEKVQSATPWGGEGKRKAGFQINSPRLMCDGQNLTLMVHFTVARDKEA